MTLPLHFVFSQASLQDYADCPRRFQLRYVLDVRWPGDLDQSSVEWEARAQWGAAFHHLIHQHTLGLPISMLSRTIGKGELRRWWHAYLTSPPQDLPIGLRRSEVRLSMPLDGARLSARYDLLAIESGQRAVIVDWKTGRRRPGRTWLAERWQTRIYPYVLVEAGTQLNGGTPFDPHQVELLYWFANYPEQVERFSYSAQQHMETGASLSALIDEILACKQEVWGLTADLRQCRYCTYRTFCGREKAGGTDKVLDDVLEGDPFDFDLDLEQIAEIEF